MRKVTTTGKEARCNGAGGLKMVATTDYLMIAAPSLSRKTAESRRWATTRISSFQVAPPTTGSHSQQVVDTSFPCPKNLSHSQAQLHSPQQPHHKPQPPPSPPATTHLDISPSLAPKYPYSFQSSPTQPPQRNPKT